MASRLSTYGDTRSEVSMRLKPGFRERVAGKFEQYQFEVGILNDKPHRRVLSKKFGLGEYAKNPVRRTTKPKKNQPSKSPRGASQGVPKKKKAPNIGVQAKGKVRKSKKTPRITIAQVSKFNRDRMKLNFYVKPFRMKQNADVVRMIRQFFNLLNAKGNERRLANAVQAVVRNPIMRMDYGRNSPATARKKGFNRLLWDSAQMFKAIKGRVIHKKKVGRNVH